MKNSQFVERRKEYRLPYHEKVIFTDGQRSGTAYAANISRGGVFVMSLDPYPIETQVHLTFFLPNQETSFCSKGKVAHIVFDRQRCEIECGMGFQLVELSDSQNSILNLHILNQQASYLELQKLLVDNRPDASAIEKCLTNLPFLRKYDLLALRYRVNRVCTIFEPVLNPFDASTSGALSA